MMKRTLMPGLWLALVAVCLFGSNAAAQQCLPEDDELESLYGFSLELATSTSQEYADQRAWFDIPMTEAENVARVFDNAVCKEASKKYKQQFQLTGPAPDVYVVQIDTRYIVLEPNTRRGEFQLYLVLDLDFNTTGSWGG